MANVTINQLPSASTIDPVQDLLPIFNNAGTATQAINRNTYLGLASAPVGLTDSQTLTNKILTSPTLNTPTVSSPTFSGTLSGTYIIGGTPTFPSSVVTLTGSQTLTNKVLTAPTITNATLSADTITGFTTSTNGTIYGIAVTGGQITGANTLATAAFGTNVIPASALATNAITLGYASITANLTTTSTSVTQATGLTSTVTVPAGGRRIKITVQTSGMANSNSGVGVHLTIWRGTVGSGTQVGGGAWTIPGAGFVLPGTMIATDTPAAGSTTYNVGWYVDANTGTLQASATQPAFILVEVI